MSMAALALALAGIALTACMALAGVTLGGALEELALEGMAPGSGTVAMDAKTVLVSLSPSLS